jgi:hypothetical protein
MKNIPSIAADATVAAERGKLSRLTAELNELRRQHEAAALGGRSPRSAFDRAVDEALGIDAPASSTSDQDKAAERVRVLAAAVERQQKIVADAESKVSRQIAEQFKPDYVAVIRRGAKAMATLRQFILEERDFRHALKVADVAFAGTIPPMPLQGFDENDVDRWADEVKQTYGIAL